MDFSKIKALVFDVDGVFTDGGIYAVHGDLIRKFEAKDCLATRVAYMKGYHMGIITGGISPTIVERMVRCGFEKEDIYLGSRKKIEQLEDFCTRHSLSMEEVMYFGDDLADLGCLKAAGIGACPADAVEEAKEVSDYVSDFCGGHFFVRKAVEMVLKAHGKWGLDEDVYKEKFEGK